MDPEQANGYKLCINALEERWRTKEMSWVDKLCENDEVPRRVNEKRRILKLTNWEERNG